MLDKRLEALNIIVIREEKVVRPSELDFGYKKYEKNVTVSTIGKRNLTIKTDMLVWAASWNLEDKLFPMSWQNELGELAVSSTFQLVEKPDVFAIGDISSVAETKQAITLPKKMKYIIHNVLAVAGAMQDGKLEPDAKLKLKHYRVSDRATMFLPIGPDFGVSQSNGWTYGDKKTRKWKGKDLYCDLFWKELTGLKAPPAPDVALKSGREVSLSVKDSEPIE